MKRSSVCILLFILLLLVGCNQVKEEPRKENMQKSMVLSFINIGKGDAFLIDVDHDGFYLCDTGKKQDFAKIARVLKMKKVNHINGIFLSHGHLDHSGNVENILKCFDVDKIYITDKDDPSYKKCPIEDIVKKYPVELVKLHSGDLLQFHDLKIHVWIPEWVDQRNENNNSLVLHMTYGNTAFLMTGDMELKEEQTFLYENNMIKSDVLKLGHHGEDDATSVALLERVKPKYGIITGNVKENPESVNPTIQQRLQAYQVEPFYSDGKQMCIDFISDKNKITINYIYDKPIKSNLRIQSLDSKKQTLVLENRGNQDYDLSHYCIRSKKGEEWYFIQEGTILKAHDKLSIGTLDSEEKKAKDLIWMQHDVWDKSKDEAAVLYDENFNKIDKKMGGN